MAPRISLKNPQQSARLECFSTPSSESSLAVRPDSKETSATIKPSKISSVSPQETHRTPPVQKSPSCSSRGTVATSPLVEPPNSYAKRPPKSGQLKHPTNISSIGQVRPTKPTVVENTSTDLCKTADFWRHTLECTASWNCNEMRECAHFFKKLDAPSPSDALVCASKTDHYLSQLTYWDRPAVEPLIVEMKTRGISWLEGIPGVKEGRTFRQTTMMVDFHLSLFYWAVINGEGSISRLRLEAKELKKNFQQKSEELMTSKRELTGCSAQLEDFMQRFEDLEKEKIEEVKNLNCLHRRSEDGFKFKLAESSEEQISLSKQCEELTRKLEATRNRRVVDAATEVNMFDFQEFSEELVSRKETELRTQFDSKLKELKDAMEGVRLNGGMKLAEREKELEELRQEAKELRTQFDSNLKELEELRQDATELRTQFDSNLKELEELQQDATELRTQFDSNLKELEVLQQDATELRTQFDSNLKEREELMDERIARETRLVKKEEELEQMRRDVKELRTRDTEDLEEARRERDRYQFEANSCQFELEEMGHQMEGLEAHNEGEMKKLSSEKIEIEAKLETSNLEIQNLNQKLTELTKEMSSNKTKQIEEANVSTAKVRELDELVQDASRQQSDLMNKLATAEEVIAKRTQEVKWAEGNAARLNEAMEELTVQRAGLTQGKLEELQRDMTTLRHEKNQLATDKHQHENEIESLHRAVSLANKENRELIVEISGLKAKLTVNTKPIHPLSLKSQIEFSVAPSQPDYVQSTDDQSTQTNKKESQRRVTQTPTSILPVAKLDTNCQTSPGHEKEVQTDVVPDVSVRNPAEYTAALYRELIQTDPVVDKTKNSSESFWLLLLAALELLTFVLSISFFWFDLTPHLMTDCVLAGMVRILGPAMRLAIRLYRFLIF